MPSDMSHARIFPQTPLLLFQQFMPVSLVDSWVKYMIEREELTFAGPHQEHSRQHTWTKTKPSEVYLFVAILLTWESIESHKCPIIGRLPLLKAAAQCIRLYDT